MNGLSCRFKSGRPQTDPRGSVFFCESAAFNTIPAFPAIFLSAQREFSRLSSERRPKARGIEAQMSGRRKGGAGQSGKAAALPGGNRGRPRIAAESPVRAACGAHAPGMKSVSGGGRPEAPLRPADRLLLRRERRRYRQRRIRRRFSVRSLQSSRRCR